MANPFDEFDEPAPTGSFTSANGESPEQIMDSIYRLPEKDRGPVIAAFNEQAKRQPDFMKTGFSNTSSPAKAASNPFDEFDTPDPVKQIPGMENTQDSSRNVGKDDSTLIDKIRGVTEAGIGAATGIPATVSEAVGQLFFGTKPGEVSSKFYQPRTEKGKEYLEDVGDFANRNLNPLLGGIGHITVPEKIRGKAPTDLEKILEQDAKEQTAAKPANPFDEFDQAPGRDTTDPFGQMKQQLDVPQQLPPEEGVNTSPAMDSVARGLQDQPATSDRINASDAADQAIAARQADLEQSVKQQGTADYNAAERARQENASLPPVEDPEVTNANPAVKGWNQLLEDEMRKDEPTSGTPAFFKDPDESLPNPSSFNTRTRRQGGGLLLDDPNKTPEPIRTKEESSSDFLKRVLSEDAKSHTGRLGAPVWTAPKAQRGAINPAVFVEGFQKLKQLADGVWLRAFSDGRGFHIEASKDGHTIGATHWDLLDKNGTRWNTLPSADYIKANAGQMKTQSFSTNVAEGSRRQGIASEMYKFAADLGNDVVASDLRSDAGKAMWKGFEEKGIAKYDSIKSLGNRQRGAVLFGKDPVQEQLKKIPGFENIGKDLIPDDPLSTDVIKAGLDYGRDNPNISKNLDSGAYMRYLKSRGNGLILGISQIVQNMGKRTDLQYRQVVHPVERAFRDLSRDELSTVVNLLKMEDANQKVFSPENLMSNLNVKQLTAYTRFRNGMDYLHTIQNGIRQLNGMDQVKKIEGYVAHNFEGDFRRPIYEAVLDRNGNPSFDAKGEPVKKLVGYLASNWKRGLEAQSEALRAKRPDLEIDAKNDHTIRYYGRNTDFEGAYSKIIDFLGRDDPAVQKLQEYMEDLTTGKAEAILQQTKHFENRAGVFGWVGTRPGMDPKAEAIHFMEEQMKYMKNGIKWYEAQKTVPLMKEILNNPELRQQQPSNMEFARDYWKNATGFGTQAAFAAAQDSLRNLGAAPQLFDKGINGLKTYFILDKLAGSLGFVTAQMIQTANVLPHLTYLFSKGFRGDPISALGVGLPSGILMAGLHFRRINGEIGAKFMEGLPDNHFLNRAFKYAEDNGVITKSINDESPIGASFNAVTAAANLAGKSISGSEAFVRGMAYMTFAQFLKNSGKFKDDVQLFQTAEAHTHAAMVDYRSSERPLIFPKMGIAGNFLNTLQTWGVNWYNQFNFAAREAFTGNVAPFLAMTMLAYATGGVMNVPYMADLDRGYEFLRDHIPSTALWMKVKDDPFWRDPKMWMANHFGESSVWGAISVNNPWGASVSSRVTAPTPFEMTQNPAGPITDLYKKGASVAHAVTHPTDPTAWKQLAMDVAPVAVKGPLETSKLMEGTTYNTKTYTDGTKGYVAERTGDLNARTGVYTRDQHDQDLRPFGFRSQKEVTEKEIGYRLTNDSKQIQERGKGLVDSFYNAVRTGNESDARDFAKTYTMLTGKPIDSDMISSKLQQEYTDTLQRAGIKASKSVSSITGYVRAKQLLDKLAAER